MFSDRGIVCAQVYSSGVDRMVKKIGYFISERPLLENPDETGRNLKIYLDSHGFTATRAVVGVPAKWTIAQEKDVPPASVEEMKSMLRLAAERLSLAETGGMAVDYAGDLKSGTNKALLVGILKSQLNKIQTLISAAELTLVGACPSALATSAFVTGDHSMLYLAQGSAELVHWQAGSPKSVRALNASGNDPTAISSELKRTLALRGGIPDNMLICNGSEMDESASNELLSRIGSSARTMTPESGLGVTIDSTAMNGSAGSIKRGTALPAVALALGGIDRSRMPIDFVTSKLQEKKSLKLGSQTVYMAIIGIGLVALIAILYFSANQRQSEANAAIKQLSDDQPKVKKSRESIAHLDYGRTYFNQRPDYLGCLKELSLMYEYDERIWVTSATLKNDSLNQIQGVIQGKSSDYTLNLKLIDRVYKNPLFSTDGLDQSRDAGGRSNEDSYTFKFKYKAGKK